MDENEIRKLELLEEAARELNVLISDRALEEAQQAATAEQIKQVETISRLREVRPIAHRQYLFDRTQELHREVLYGIFAATGMGPGLAAKLAKLYEVDDQVQLSPST